MSFSAAIRRFATCLSVSTRSEPFPREYQDWVSLLGGSLTGFSISPSLANPKAAGLLKYGGTYAGAYLLRRGLFMPWELETLSERRSLGWVYVASTRFGTSKLG